MNILMISHEYPPVGGGGANACMNLAREYINQGHQVTILTVWYEGTAADEEKGALHIIRLKARRKHKEHCGFPEMMDYMLKAAWYGNGVFCHSQRPGGIFPEKEISYPICSPIWGRRYSGISGAFSACLQDPGPV